MPQSFVQAVTNTFVKGLITEAGPLTFPKDASVDELNCNLERDGSRRRRLAIKYEDDYEFSSFTVSNAYKVKVVGKWENVGGDGSVSFAVVQYANSLVFFELATSPLSAGRVPTSFTNATPYRISLSSYRASSSVSAGGSTCDVTSIDGKLVVVSKDIDSFYVSRNTETGAFSVTSIDLQERDFEWLSIATQDPYVAVASGQKRLYDTQNSGWVGEYGDAALSDYITAESLLPPLTHPWYSGKDSSGSFDVTEYKKIFLGSSLTANGHYILDIFSKERAAASGLSVDDTDSTKSSRFSTAATYAGRVFYSGVTFSDSSLGSKVYFSQIIENVTSDLGKCYQRNDPTSEEFPDLLDTDGGVIFLPEVSTIRKLHVFGPTLYVFADNGVWSISGVDDVFRASEYSVSKLTEVGLKYKDSFLSAEGRPYWWSNNGIHTLALNDQIGTIVEQNISQSTVQTFFRNIPEAQKAKVLGVYDARNQRVCWMYPDADDALETEFTHFLFFDEVFSAFYPWSMGGPNQIIGAVFDEGIGTADITYDVVDNDGTPVVTNAGNQVVVTDRGPNYLSSGLKFLVKDLDTQYTTWAEFTGTDFLDYGVTSYESYAEAGYDFLGDLTVFKNAPYVTVYLKVTEEGYTGDETNGYEPIRPSSCFVKCYWDFKNQESATAQQTYRFKFPLVVNPSDLTEFSYPTTVLTTRLRVRGRGRSMRLRFESEQGKDWHLLGWETVAARNPTF